MGDEWLMTGPPMVNVGTAQRPRVGRARGTWMRVPSPAGGMVRLSDYADPEQRKCEILAQCGLLLEAFDELGIGWEEAVERRYCANMATSQELWELAWIQGKLELAERIRELLEFPTYVAQRPAKLEFLRGKCGATDGTSEDNQDAGPEGPAAARRRTGVANGFQQVVALGHLAKDGELAYVGAGETPKLSFRLLACTGFGASEHCEGFNVGVWGRRAVALAPYMTKGRRVLVAGTLHTREYEQNGETKYYTELRAEQITLQPAGMSGRPSEEDGGEEGALKGGV
jgi:single-strand DNA-binding protein